MKAFSDLRRFSCCWLKTIPLFLAFVMAAAGCSKSGNQPAAGPQVPTPSANSTSASSTTPPAASSQAVTAPAPNLNLQLLNRALMRWMIKNRRHPQNFEDFASSASIQIPDPPAGKKYALNGKGFIVLVDFSPQ